MAVFAHGRLWTLAGGAVLTLVAAIGFPSFGGVAHAQDPPKRFEWNYDIRSGDCTMFHGAAWRLQADGTAFFNGVVTSGANNDAWLMHADLQDVNRKYLGNIIANQLNSDIGKFVMNLPDKSRQYSWKTRGTFDPRLYPRIKNMALHSHC